MKRKLLLIIGAICLYSLGTFAQFTATGTVIDVEGDALIGATILVKGSSEGVATDIDGNFSVGVPSNTGTLIISYTGHQTMEVEVTSATPNVNITLPTSNLQLSEIIVTAYGLSTKEDFTGSADVVTSKDLALRSVTSPIAAIEGKATGVQFTSASGQPGSSPDIVIRGVGTLNGSTDPLFIVDGMQYEGDLNTINQDDIESFTILKDAASTSLYGSRAANGVVIITTKKGEAGELQVNASTKFGMVSRGISAYEEVTPGQYYESMWQALKNSSAGNGDPAFASAEIYNSLQYNPFDVPNENIVGTDGKLNPSANLVYKGLDWYDLMEQTGLRQSYNVNVSGGGDKHSFFLSTSYLDEEGYVVKTNYDRLTTRLNADFDANDWLTLGGSANVGVANSSGPTSAGAGSIVNPFGFAKNIGSIYPVYVNDQQGNFVLDAGGNPVFDNGEGFPDNNIGSRPVNQGRHALQELLLNDERKRNNNYGFRAFADFHLLDGLKFSLNYGRDIFEGVEKEYENNIIGDAQPTGRYGEERSRLESKNFNQVLTYTKSFVDVHNVGITAGHESYDRNYTENNALAIDQVAEGIFEFDNFATPIRVGGFSEGKRTEGYFLRANYNYDNRYYISASARRDGSSVFSTDSRWGNFYSVGGAWRLDQEAFMENVSFVDRLKLRASIGQVGNDNLNDFYISQPRYGLTSNAGNPAIIWSDIGNANLQWETVGSFDVAFEFTLFNSFLDGTLEYYQKNSTDLLYELPIAPSNGINVFPSNVADVVNSGIELSLTGHLIKTTDFRWDLNLQGTKYLKSEITSIPDPFINGSKRWAEGRGIYDFFLLHTAGVDEATGDQLFLMFEIDEETEEVVPVLDANGVQETTNDWEETERAYTGDSAIPEIVGGISNSFSYKGFSLGVLITYGIGGKFLDNGYSAMMHSGTYGRSLHPDALNAWRQPGDVTDVPRLENGNPALVRTQSTRFLTDASFWTLKNINLGYALNRRTAEKLGLGNLRLSVTGENLYLKSKRTGLDPQYNLGGTPDGDDFSPSRIFSVGLNATF